MGAALRSLYFQLRFLLGRSRVSDCLSYCARGEFRTWKMKWNYARTTLRLTFVLFDHADFYDSLIKSEPGAFLKCDFIRKFVFVLIDPGQIT